LPEGNGRILILAQPAAILPVCHQPSRFTVPIFRPVTISARSQLRRYRPRPESARAGSPGKTLSDILCGAAAMGLASQISSGRRDYLFVLNWAVTGWFRRRVFRNRLVSTIWQVWTSLPLGRGRFPRPAFCRSLKARKIVTTAEKHNLVRRACDERRNSLRPRKNWPTRTKR